MNGNTTNVAVMDAFDIRANTPGSKHAPGLVVVFDGRQCANRMPLLNEMVELLRPDGSTASAAVAEIKEHGAGRSFFFNNLKKEDAPIGTVMSWAIGQANSTAQSRQHAIGR